jgi:hypothetical protein
MDGFHVRHGVGQGQSRFLETQLQRHSSSSRGVKTIEAATCRSLWSTAGPGPGLKEGGMQDAGDGRMADHKQSRRPRLEMGLGRVRYSAGHGNVPASSLSALRRAILRRNALPRSIR